MKKIYNYALVLILCFALSACSAKRPFTQWAGSGQVSGAIWYTLHDVPVGNKPVMEVPLLVHAEWDNAPTQKGNLALVFLHGNLFSKCSYDNTGNVYNGDSADNIDKLSKVELICETNSSFPGAKSMAYDCAMLVSAVINDLQGIPVIVTPEWNFTIKPMQSKNNNKHPRTYSVQKNDTSIVLEIKEATWR